MSLPTAADVRALIDAPCLVQMDRAGRGLFVTDFARRVDAGAAAEIAERLAQAGYVLEALPNGMTLVDWPEDLYLAYFKSLPAPRPGTGYGRDWALYRMLMQHPAPLEKQDARTLTQALRLCRLAKTEALYDLLKGAFADALRRHQAPPYHAAHLLSAWELTDDDTTA